MKLVYGITVSTEQDEIKNLVSFIRKHTNDDIIIQYDSTKASSELLDNLKDYDVKLNGVIFSNHFSDFKNELNRFCEDLGADYIFQLDADEIISEHLIKNVKEIINANPDIELYFLSRINTVDGLTNHHIKKWGWNVNDKGWINFPDEQGRIYKSKCRWKGKVHEMIFAPETYSFFPILEEFCIIHNKDITKQEYQNNFYSKI